MAFVFMLLTLAAISTGAGLQVRLFNNTALAGHPMTSPWIVQKPTFTHKNRGAPFSASMTGTLTADRGYSYVFNCSFGGAVLGFAHIDGHLVCQTGVNGPHPPAGPSVISTAYDNPLPVLSATAWPVRLLIVHNGTGHDEVTFGMNISRQLVFHGGEANGAGDNHTGSDQILLPDRGSETASGSDTWLDQEGVLSPDLAAAEMQRDMLQQQAAQGWAPWYDMSYTRLVRLPEGSTLTIALCDNGSSDASDDARCITETRTDWKPPHEADVVLRLGPHAYDRSYAQLFLATATCNVSIAYGGGAHLLVSVDVVDGCGNGTELVLAAGSAWYRLHTLGATMDSLTFTPFGDGVKTTAIFSTVPGGQSSLVIPQSLSAQPHLVLPLSRNTSVGLSDERLGHSEIRARLNAAWLAERQRYDAYGELAEVKMAVQGDTRVKGPDPHLTAPTLSHAQPHQSCPSRSQPQSRSRPRFSFHSRCPSGSCPTATPHSTISKVFPHPVPSATPSPRAHPFPDRIPSTRCHAAGVMWNVVWNPIESVIAPVIRGNPWGWDPATVNDDWPYVLFDWDTHFAAYMLSLDARELGYSTLIQVCYCQPRRPHRTAPDVAHAHDNATILT